MDIKINELTKDDYKRLRELVNWGNPLDSGIEKLLKNSFVVLSAHIDGEVVGMIRAISDKSYSYFIKDLVVDPKYQHRGIGKALIEKLEEYIKEESKGEIYMIELSASNNAIGFYEELGYSIPKQTVGMRKIIK